MVKASSPGDAESSLMRCSATRRSHFRLRTVQLPLKRMKRHSPDAGVKTWVEDLPADGVRMRLQVSPALPRPPQPVTNRPMCRAPRRASARGAVDCRQRKCPVAERPWPERRVRTSDFERPCGSRTHGWTLFSEGCRCQPRNRRIRGFDDALTPAPAAPGRCGDVGRGPA
jgi:hypothetical protein